MLSLNFYLFAPLIISFCLLVPAYLQSVSDRSMLQQRMWYVVWIIVGMTFPSFKFSGNSMGNRFPVQKESINVFYFIFDDWNTVMKLIFYDNSFNRILNFLGSLVNNKWGVVFKNGPGKICGRQPLKIWSDMVYLSRSWSWFFVQPNTKVFIIFKVFKVHALIIDGWGQTDMLKILKIYHYLKKEVSDESDFLHADKHQCFLQVDTIFFVGFG